MSVQAQIAMKPAAAPAVSRAPAAYGILQRKCACGGTAGMNGECEECKKRGGATLQRRAASEGSGPTPVPQIVHDVLRSPGQPLDKNARAFFEPRFGHDFSKVRVHADEQAAQSVRAVNATAYTVGNNVVFGTGQYRPDQGTGRRLLAHELAHVVQQSSDLQSAPHRISDPNESSELEAESIARTVSLGEMLGTKRIAASAATVARDGTVEPPPLEMAPITTPLTEPAPRSPGDALPTPPRYAPPVSDRSWDAMYKRAQMEPDRESAIAELERPTATLARGGAPPDFVTTYSPRTFDLTDGQFGNFTVTFTPHAFHLLDALENDVAAVTSGQQLIDVYRAYFPDSVLRFGQPSLTPTSGGSTKVAIRYEFNFDPDLIDKGGDVRTPVFVEAVRKRTQQIPSLSTDALLEAVIRELVTHEVDVEAKAQQKQKKEGPCLAQEVNRSGGDAAHNAYASSVTHSSQDYLIVTPEGRKCLSDGRDSMNPLLVWEVKTRHEWATSYGVQGSIFAPRIQGAIFQMEEQRSRCLDVTERCGFKYAYSFETPEAMDFMKKLWGNRPPVYNI